MLLLKYFRMIPHFICSLVLWSAYSTLPAQPAFSSSSEHFSPVFEECIDEAMQRMGINLDMETDPALLGDVLKNDMFLSDLPRVKSILGAKLEQANALRPMLEEVRTSILEKHPAIGEFICSALASDLIETLEDNRYVVRTIHHMYLLDDVIKAMYADYTFMNEVNQHLLHKREELGVRGNFIGSSSDIFKATSDPFFVAKAKTMDATFSRYQYIRESGLLSTTEVALRKLGLVTNISEAVLTDSMQGFRDNALVGIGLALNPIEDLTLEGEERILHYYLSQEWTSLYETWNLAFITGKMDNLHLFYPKLLIPQVINAPSNDYLFNRGLALWTAINFHLLNKLAGHPVVEVPHAKEMSRLWGEINLKYAKSYVAKENNVDLESFRGRLKAGALNTLREIKKFVRASAECGEKLECLPKVFSPLAFSR